MRSDCEFGDMKGVLVFSSCFFLGGGGLGYLALHVSCLFVCLLACLIALVW